MRLAIPRQIASVLVVVFSASAFAFAQSQGDVTFKDQIRQFLMKGDDTEKVDGALTFTDTTVTMTPKKKGAAVTTIAYESISGLVYDRRSRVRKMFVGSRGISKAEDHFLTIQYTTPDGTGSFIEIEMGKNAAPRVLATMEARSGKKIERSSGS